MTILHYITYGVLAFAIIATGFGLLYTRKPVYSALFMALNFMSVAIIYVALDAPYIALAQIIVYGGAIMVLFLFVIMLLGEDLMPRGESIRFQRPLSILFAVAAAALFALYLLVKTNPLPGLASGTEPLATPAELGMLVFSKYVLPFEIVGLLLLVSTVGAIVLSAKDTPPEPAEGEVLEGGNS
ncbi:MAG TPA: NADH-quinone oxidoreductase subunit J [Bellilinea sp.]|nr:NADH-quinone oxidoreductase subunit J [Bellilinea sp.]